MFRPLKGHALFSRIGTIVVASLVVSKLMAAPSPQNGRGGVPNAASQQQQSDQLDRTQQQQQQLQNQQDLEQRADNLRRLQDRMYEFELERERLKNQLRENFRNHYKIVRNDVDELKRLAGDLQSYAETDFAPQFPSEMLAKVAKIEKLAHEVRTNMAGRKLPEVKSASATANATGLNPQQLLLTRSKAVTELASRLQKAVADYLADNNEQTVSVKGLKTNSGFDPNSVAILTASMQLEQLARQIRSANQPR